MSVFLGTVSVCHAGSWKLSLAIGREDNVGVKNRGQPGASLRKEVTQRNDINASFVLSAFRTRWFQLSWGHIQARSCWFALCSYKAVRLQPADGLSLGRMVLYCYASTALWGSADLKSHTKLPGPTRLNRSTQRLLSIIAGHKTSCLMMSGSKLWLPNTAGGSLCILVKAFSCCIFVTVILVSS